MKQKWGLDSENSVMVNKYSQQSIYNVVSCLHTTHHYRYGASKFHQKGIKEVIFKIFSWISMKTSNQQISLFQKVLAVMYIPCHIPVLYWCTKYRPCHHIITLLSYLTYQWWSRHGWLGWQKPTVQYMLPSVDWHFPSFFSLSGKTIFYLIFFCKIAVWKDWKCSVFPKSSQFTALWNLPFPKPFLWLITQVWRSSKKRGDNMRG